MGLHQPLVISRAWGRAREIRVKKVEKRKKHNPAQLRYPLWTTLFFVCLFYSFVCLFGVFCLQAGCMADEVKQVERLRLQSHKSRKAGIPEFYVILLLEILLSISSHSILKLLSSVTV